MFLKYNKRASHLFASRLDLTRGREVFFGERWRCLATLNISGFLMPLLMAEQELCKSQNKHLVHLMELAFSSLTIVSLNQKINHTNIGL